MTELQIWTYILVGASFVLYFGIAWWARAGSTSDFYVAGGGIGPIQNGMATAADWMSAASFISMAGIIAFKGYDASAYLMGWTGGYVLMAMLLAPYLRKFGKFTVPEFVGDRYYSKTARIVAVACLIVISLTYVIGQMKGVGVTFSRFLGVSMETGSGCGYDYRVLLCSFRRHERHHLHANRAIRGVDLGLHCSCGIHFLQPDWQPYSTIGLRLDNGGWQRYLHVG